MRLQEKREVEILEDVVMTCYGKPQGDELPQVASSDDIVSTLTDTIQ